MKKNIKKDDVKKSIKLLKMFMNLNYKQQLEVIKKMENDLEEGKR